MADQPGPGIIYATSRGGDRETGRAAGRPAARCCRITPGSTRRCGGATRTPSSAPRRWWWPPPSPSAWASTSPTCASSPTPESRSRSRPIYQETGRAGRDGDPAEAWLFWGADDFARARRRIETEVEPDAAAAGARAAERAGRRSSRRRPAAGRSCFAISARTRPSNAAIATIAWSRPRPSTSPRWRANCCRRRSAPKCGSASPTSPRCLAATTMRRCASSAITARACSGSWRADELALVRPVARSLMARDALRSDDYGGLSFGPGRQADPQGRAERW